LSMWMSNTATTLVMLPIAMSLLDSLCEFASPQDLKSPRPRHGGEGQGEGASVPNDEQQSPFSLASGEKAPKGDEGVVTDVGQEKRSNPEAASETNPPLSLTLSPAAGARGLSTRRFGDAEMNRLATAVLLGIAYAASIGGLTTLVGTPTNIVFGDL